MSERTRREFFRDFETWGHDHKGWAATTRHSYCLRARKADTWLQAHRQTSILRAGQRELEAFLFTQSATARTRNNTRQALVAFGWYMVDRRIRPDNPALSLPRLREPQLLPKPLSVENAKLLVALLPALDPMERALVALMLFAGLRRSETQHLQWSHLDGWDYVHVHGKGAKTRVMPLHDNAREALQSWKLSCPSIQWVFPSPRDYSRPVSESTIRDALLDVGERCSFDFPLKPHALRHTFATGLADNGADLAQIQEALGHRDPKNTMIYTRVRPHRVAEAIHKLTYALAPATMIVLAIHHVFD